jgi:hypothetical protein
MRLRSLLVAVAFLTSITFLLPTSGLLAQKALSDSFTIICDNENANCDRNENIQLVEEFWRLAQAGELEAAKSLTSNKIVVGDTIKGGTASLIDTSPTGWEDTIHETGMNYVKTIGIMCSDNRECKVVGLVKNRWGRIIKFVHVLRVREGDWKIIHIMW